jgi:hypothetical protein
LIALATQQTVAKHQYRVSAVEPCPSRQVFCEFLGLLWIDAQKEGCFNGPQANTTLNAAVVDAVAQANTVDDLWVVLDVLERGNRGDVHVRVPLAWEYASVAFDRHQSARGRGQRVLGRETVDVQHIGCIARPAGVHHVEGILADATRYNGANRDAGLDDRVQAILPVAHGPRDQV